MKIKSNNKTEKRSLEQTNVSSGVSSGLKGISIQTHLLQRQANIINNSLYMARQRKSIQYLDTLQKKKSRTGLPDEVQSKMERSFNADFSDVRIHKNSSTAFEVGALAYTQGSDVHFAPGQFSPETSSGQRLLGHELTHVVQQREGRVQPTTEVAGLPVNENPALEDEADLMGIKVSR
ncbi:MAG: DUF4157 domain-containing protein [Desulfosarcina sp.]|nr:DUF4157 domain-containing protein [Desulfobacterales bacterium]